MKRMFVVLAVVIASGCASMPVYKVRAFGDKDSCMALDGKDVLFTIVTDGQIARGGVSNVIFRGPRYNGEILSPGDTHRIRFHASSRMLLIGSQGYDLTDGNLFLVSVRSEPGKVIQLKISEEDKISSVLQTDNRVTSFF